MPASQPQAHDGEPSGEAGPDACPVCASATLMLERYRPAHLRTCPQCTLVFQSDRSPAELRTLYTAEYFEGYGCGHAPYEADDEARAREAHIRVGLLAAYIRPPAKVLEIGSASGHFLAAAREAGYEVLGVEPEEGIARRARERLHLDIRTGFVEDVPLESGGFDAVCAWHVLEHMPQPLTALRRAHDLLSPGGHLFAEVPNFHSAPARREGPRWLCLDLRHHVCQYGPRSLSYAARVAGFQVLSTRTVSSLAYLPAAAAWRPRKLIRRARTRGELLRLVARRP